MKTAEEKRNYNRAYLAKRRANRTPEQKEADRAYQRAYRAQRKQREDKVLERFQQNNDYEEVKELWEKKEKRRAYYRAYYKANKKKMNSQMKKWREESPDYHKNYQPNYLDNLDLTDETTDNQTRLLAWGRQVRKRDNNKCYYHSSECSSLIDAHHIIPKEWKSKSSLHNFAAMKFSLDNGMCLCRKHHKEVHKEITNWMRE